MRRATATAPGADAGVPGVPVARPAPAPAPTPTPAPLRTEYDFVLPRGYVDDEGVVHRDGTMRLATARDELLPLYDGRVRERPEWLSVVLLSRVLTRLGTITDVTDRVIENLFASDL